MIKNKYKKIKKKKIRGSELRPRLSVKKSNRHIYAQIIDDAAGKTLVFVSSLSKEVEKVGTKLEIAKRVGDKISQKAKLAGIQKVVFDIRPYHGVKKALAESFISGLSSEK